MPHETIDARAEDTVEQPLELLRRALPMGADAGRAFGLDEPAAVRVRDTGALPHGEARPLRGDVRRGPRPELAVRNVARAQDLQRIDRRVAGAARLRIDHHAVGVGQLAERFVVVVQNTVAHRAAHVLQEAVRDLRTLHHPPGHHGQVTPQVVAAETAELLRETLRPIDETHLPTVGQQEPDAVAGLLRRADQRQQHAVAVEREGFRVEVIERKALPAIARRRGARPGAGPGVADHGPLPFRSVPYEFPPVETGGDVENLLPAERLGPRIVIEIRAQQPERENLLKSQPAVKRLRGPVRNGRILHRGSLRRFPHGLYADVPADVPRGRLRQFDLDPPAAPDVRLGVGQPLQGALGRDEWTAGIPSARGIDAQRDAQPVGLADGMAVQSLPPFRQEYLPGTRSGGDGVESSGVDQRRRTVPLGLHLLQIARDGLFGRVAVQPPPVARHAGLAGRRAEFAGQFGRRGIHDGLQPEIGLRPGPRSRRHRQQQRQHERPNVVFHNVVSDLSSAIHNALRSPSLRTTHPFSGNPGASPAGAPSQPAAIIATAYSSPPFPGK